MMAKKESTIKEEIVCPLCGRIYTKAGFLGHMRLLKDKYHGPVRRDTDDSSSKVYKQKLARLDKLILILEEVGAGKKRLHYGWPSESLKEDELSSIESDAYFAIAGYAYAEGITYEETNEQVLNQIMRFRCN